MGFRINTNIAALSSHQSATVNNRNLDNSLSKLSSGLRINKAADDASGLAIANSLRSQASSLGQAISNGNDAVGLLQTADGALSEYSNILDTIKTKSVQAASDGQNTASRLAIQKDIDALMKELNVIANTTSFNGQKLLSGTFANKEFQMGANANESVNVSIGSTETSQIGQTSRAQLEIAKLGENQLTLRSATTGKELTLDPFNIQYDNTVESGMGGVAAQINKYSSETGITAKAVVSSDTGVISAGTTDSTFAINGITIGAIVTEANDASGTLQNAINSKTTETGVTATRTTDGQLSLTSADGRAIKVENLSGIAGNTDQAMSTTGYLDVVQAGSTDFQIVGAEQATAVGAKIELSSAMGTLIDSQLAKGSSVSQGSTLVEGTKIGFSMVATIGMSLVANSSTADMTLATNSVLLAGTTFNKDTVIGAKINVSGDVVLSSDMLLKAGSVIATGTIFDAGTTLQQDMTIAGVDYKAGTVLVTDATFAAADQTTLVKDMVMFVDVNGTNNAKIAAGSQLQKGSVLGGDIGISSSVTLDSEMTLKAGSFLGTGSTLGEGTVLGQSITLTAATLYATTSVTELKSGSILGSASILEENSTIGGKATLLNDETMASDVLLKSGSVIASGSTLAKGTILTQDLSADEVGGGSGEGLKAGTVLGVAVVTTKNITLADDMTVLKDSILLATSSLAPNGGERNSVQLSNKEFTALSDIDVTTLEGAMKAIDTVGAAIKDLDTIRSIIGSAQNQVVSTINNISVTQVNVKAAESNLRDVDFAAESANFSKFNILAQSGSYAMSQANAVQQNVMRLLQ